MDRSGKIIVNSDLSVPGYPEIFAIGDTAHVVAQARNLLGMKGERATGHAWSSAAGNSRGQVRGRLTTNGEIAALLFITEETVKNHVKHILEKVDF